MMRPGGLDTVEVTIWINVRVGPRLKLKQFAEKKMSIDCGLLIHVS